MNSHLISNRQVNSTTITDYSTIISKNKKSSKSTKISFINSALQSVKKTTKKRSKSEDKIENLYSILPSVYLEEHKGMDWRLQQLGYQLPEQDERLLADNTHLSNELKFLRAQQKLCSIPIKLYLNNKSDAINQQQLNNSSVSSNETVDKQVNNEQQQVLFCNKCEQVINKSSYCVQADLSNLNFFLHTKTNNQPNDSTIQSSSATSTPADLNHHIYFHIDCLQCITCSEIIVDFRAFGDPRTTSELNSELNSVSKLRIYCSRHFLELFKPRCQMCEELIFDKKCTSAEGKAWHVSHFSCFNCKIPLGGQQYKMANLSAKKQNHDDKMKLEDLQSKFNDKPKISKDIHPFCLSCCDQLFGEYCARCNQLITCDQNPVKFEKYFWHAKPECFHCDTCGINLVNSDYLPSSSAKQIFCSTKCAQSLQAKDLNNVSNGLMKLNDRLRTSIHKPILNSVKEEDDLNCLEQQDNSENCRPISDKVVEYENSIMFHLASNVNSNNKDNIDQKDKKHQIDKTDQSCSPSSNRSSNRSLSSLSLLFSSSPNSDQNESSNSSTFVEEQVEENEKTLEDKASIESVSSSESEKLNSSTSTIVKKEEISKDNKSIDSSKIDAIEKQQQSNDELDHQRLVPYVIVNNNPFTRMSIIIDNTTGMQILDEFENINSSNNSDDKSNNSTSSVQSDKISLNCSLDNKSLNNDKSNLNTKTSLNNNNNPISKENNRTTLLNSSQYSNSLVQHYNQQQQQIQQQVPAIHYSTLPTRKTQRRPFKYEEPTIQTIQNAQKFDHQIKPFSNNNKNVSSQSIIDFNHSLQNSGNEIGLPIINKNFVNCTLPRNRSSNNNNFNQTNEINNEISYLNGAQSKSISKLNATILKSNFNRLPAKYLQSTAQQTTDSFGNVSLANSDFSTGSSNSKNSLTYNQTLNSHSVIVSEDQLIESLNSKLVVKPLLQNKIPNRTPPPLPSVEQHGFIRKWSTTNSSNSSTTSTGNQLKDLPAIKETHLIISNNNSSQNNSERTSSTTPSISSSIEIQSKEETNLVHHQNCKSSNNSLNNILSQTNLNSSNSASFISATSSINSTISSSNETSSTTTSQLTRLTANLIHNRPDVISHLDPIETMKQLKQKQRELKLKEKRLKKAEQQQQQKQQQQQQQSIDLKPKIIEEKLKTNTSSGKNNNEKMIEKEMMNNNKKNNNNTARTMSTNNLTNTSDYEKQKIRLNSSVSNSLSSLNHKNHMVVNNKLKHCSQPNLLIVNQKQQDSNGETCSNSSPSPIEYQLEDHDLNRLDGLNEPSSSQCSPTNVNDTDSSSIVNNIEMDNIVQFKSQLDKMKQLPHKRQQTSLLKDTQQLNKNCESQTNLKQKSVSFDPRVIENENSKAPKRLNRKSLNNHYRYSSSKKKYSSKYDDENYESNHHHKRRKRKTYHRDHYKSKGSNSSRRSCYEDDDNDSICSTCSSCSSSSSSSFYSSSDEEKVEKEGYRHGYSCHGRKNYSIKKQPVDKLSNSNKNLTKTTSIPTEQMVQIMKQQQLIIQQHQLLAQQMQPQLKQKRYLKNNTNESCVIS